MATVEQDIQTKGLTAPRVTPADIEAMIISENYFNAGQVVGTLQCNHGDVATISDALARLTLCVLVLRNGFTVTGESACASPENFDTEVGQKIARAHAVEKIGPLLGFRLRDQLMQPVLSDADAMADLEGVARPASQA